MVKERGFVDAEAGKSMRSWGWSAWKHRDALMCPYCHKMVLPSGSSGTFDYPGVWVPLFDDNRVLFIDVEVKAADKSFPFSDFKDNQREWAESNQENEKWVWLGIGLRIGHAKYPRKTWFFPLCMLYELENELERKSIPFRCEDLEPYRLIWEGNGLWSMPDHHPFNKR